MNNIVVKAAVATAAMGLAFPALADEHMAAREADWRVDEQVEILERNAQGKATKVRVGEWTYPVCMSERMTDGCIQPRAAGLDWGPWPADSSDNSDRS